MLRTRKTKVVVIVSPRRERSGVFGQFRRKGSHSLIAGFRDIACSAGIVGANSPAHFVGLQPARALGQQNKMRIGGFYVADFCARDAEYVDMYAHECFVNDVKAAGRQQPMNVGHTSVGGVFDRQHGKLGRARIHRLDHVFEGAAGHRFVFGTRLDASLMGIGAGLSLECNTCAHLVVYPTRCDKKAFRRRCYRLKPNMGSG